MTFEELLKIFPKAKRTQWRRPERGRGWVRKTAHADASCLIDGVVADRAKVHERAVVEKNALVLGTAFVGGDAQIRDAARVCHDANVQEGAVVCDSASVGGQAKVKGWAVVGGRSKVHGAATVEGSCSINGDAEISGEARIGGHAQVSGNAHVGSAAIVSGHAEISGKARVYGGAWKMSPLYIQGSRFPLTVCAPGEIAIGCNRRSLQDWKAHGRTIALRNDFSKGDIAEYALYVQLAEQWMRAHGMLGQS